MNALPELYNLNIYLVGMMGCGKSTVGRALAELMDYRFMDTDHLVEQVSRQSIASIFAMAGEAEFRAIESKVLAEISAYTRLLIATGGGIVLRQENWGYLRQGLVVWLDVTPEVIWARIGADPSRPLLQDPDPQGKLQELLTARRSRYGEADLRIEIAIETPPALVAQEILAQIPSVLKSKTANA
jgi:shikimate kinase